MFETMHLTTRTLDGQGVSTLERDDITKLLGSFAGVDVANYELAVFKRGELLFEHSEDVDDLPEEDVTPVHVEYFDTAEEAQKGHDRVVAAINAGTLTYSGVPAERR